jgi:DNA-binding transcriptional ArsR family regulator
MEDALKLQIIFQTLGEANRLRIIKFIGDKECSVSQIVEATGLSQPLVSHHLRTLRENKILETKRQGPFVYYKLKDARLLDALGMLLEIFASSDIEIKEPMFCSPRWWKDYL